MSYEALRICQESYDNMLPEEYPEKPVELLTEEQINYLDSYGFNTLFCDTDIVYDAFKDCLKDYVKSGKVNHNKLINMMEIAHQIVIKETE